MDVVQLNVGGWSKGYPKIADELHGEQADAILLTETWRKDDLQMNGFVCVCEPAVKAEGAFGRRSGGLLTAIRPRFRHEVISSQRFSTHVKLVDSGIHLVSSYFPPETSPREPFPVSEIISHISAVYAECSGETVILTGDFNCRIDGKDGERSRGEELVSGLELIGLHLSYVPDRPTFDGRGESKIDLLFSNRNDLLASATVVESNLLEHNRVVSRWRLRRGESSDPREWSASRPVRVVDKRRVDPKLGAEVGRLLRSDGVDAAVDRLTEHLLQAGVAPKKGASKPWMTRQCHEKMQELRAASGDRREPLRTELTKLIDHLKSALNERRALERVVQCGDKPWLMATKQKMRALPWRIRAAAYAHFTSILSRGDPAPELRVVRSSGRTLDGWSRAFTVEEVREVLAQCKLGKAPGPDGLTGEVLRTTAEVLLPAWLAVFNHCLMEGTIPEAWRLGTLLLLYKGKGGISNIDSYRGVNLQSAALKMLTRLVKNRLVDKLDCTLESCQFGFRKGRSTEQAITHLVKVVSELLNHEDPRKKKCAFAGLVDFAKAFDTPDRSLIDEKLVSQFGVRGKLLGLIRALLRPNRIVIRDGCWASDEVTQTNGVAQGDSLSPYLFVLFINDLAKAIRKRAKVKLVLYADDLTMVSGDKAEMIKALDALHNWCEANGMKVNVQKTKIMKFRKKNSWLPGERDGFAYGDTSLETVDTCTFLGVHFQPTLCVSKHVSKVKARCIAAFTATCHGLGAVSVATGLRIFGCLFAPILTYAIRAIAPLLTYKNMEELDRALHAFLRRLLLLPQQTRRGMLDLLAGSKRLSQQLHERGVGFRKEAWMQYAAEREKEERDFKATFSEAGLARGPAFKHSYWRNDFARCRYETLNVSANGFRYLLCSKKGFHPCGAACACSRCGEALDDVLHILGCVSLEHMTLKQRVAVLKGTAEQPAPV